MNLRISGGKKFSISLRNGVVSHAAWAILASTLTHAVAAEDNGAKAYVTMQDDRIAVLDLATMSIASSLPTQASSSRGVGLSSDGSMLITANGDDGDVSLVNRTSGALLARIPIGKNPEFVRVRGDYAFVTFEPASLGGPPPAPGSAEAKALAKSRDDDDAEPAKIAVIDLKQRKVIREITGGMETEGIEFSPDGKRILVTNEADDNVSVHEVSTGRLITKVNLKRFGHRPRGIKIAPDASFYVVSLEFGNKLVILGPDFKPRKAVETGEVPYGLAFDRKGERLLVALSKGAALQVFDAKTLKELGRAPTGKRCWHFTFTPDDRHILAACGRSDEIVVIDAATLQVEKRITGLKSPWGIVTYPKSSGSLDQP